MSEPKLVLVESFDELRVGQAVWVNLECCGKLGGRFIIVQFKPKNDCVDSQLRVFVRDSYKFEPRHVCRVSFYPAPRDNCPVGASLITPEMVADRDVYVEVIDLREREEERERVPLAIRTK